MSLVTTRAAQMPTAPNPPLIHPGPVIEPRINAAPTAVRRFNIETSGNCSFEEQVLAAFAREGLVGGAVEIEGLDCRAIDYVIPAHSEFPERLAWYSSPRTQKGPARILKGHVSVGREQGNGMIHCHGIWQLADGRRAIGHLLGAQTVPEPGQLVRAIGFEQAGFERNRDPETNFDLFAATRLESATTVDAVVVTLRPNEDIPSSCRALCRHYGFTQARVIGLGSLNGAGFVGVTAMRDHVSEFLIRQGSASPEEATIEIAVVDSAANCFEGTLATGQGRVSITSELVLLAVQAHR